MALEPINNGDLGPAIRALINAAIAYLPDTLTSGEWKPLTGWPRLLLNGTGTVSIDARNRAGTVTTGVFTQTLSSAVNEIAFPYFGDDAVEVRATLTGTATAEIL